MENNFNVDGMSGFGIINLKKIKNCEAELIERYIHLKNEIKILTLNFLY